MLDVDWQAVADRIDTGSERSPRDQPERGQLTGSTPENSVS
jgi:hypothetical protein